MDTRLSLLEHKVATRIEARRRRGERQARSHQGKRGTRTRNKVKQGNRRRGKERRERKGRKKEGKQGKEERTRREQGALQGQAASTTTRNNRPGGADKLEKGEEGPKATRTTTRDKEGQRTKENRENTRETKKRKERDNNKQQRGAPRRRKGEEERGIRDRQQQGATREQGKQGKEKGQRAVARDTIDICGGSEVSLDLNELLLSEAESQKFVGKPQNKSPFHLIPPISF